MTYVTVVIPFYNGIDYLNETLISIINQSFKNWECLVIDDHSPVSGETIVNDLGDPRIKYIINNRERGMANARNYGSQLAAGKYIALNDQDDLSAPGRLKNQFEFLENNPEYLLCGTWRQNFEGDKTEYRHETDADLIKIRMIGNSQFSNPSIMFHKSMMSDYNLYFRQEFAPADDYDFLSRVVLKGKTTNLPKFLLLYRIHVNQESTKNIKVLEEKAIEIRKNYITELLGGWELLGFSADEMAIFMSPIKIKEFTASQAVNLINKWNKFNKDLPVFPAEKWEDFLFSRLIVVLPELHGSLFVKFRIAINYFTYYAFYAKKHGIIKTLKLIVKIVI